MSEVLGSVGLQASPVSPSPSLANEPATPSWHSAYVEKPSSGRKIIAVYDDWSGARLFFVHEGGFIDQDGDDRDDLDSFAVWAYLPPFAKLWCEICEDPLTLSTEGVAITPDDTREVRDGEAAERPNTKTSPQPKDNPQALGEVG